MLKMWHDVVSNKNLVLFISGFLTETDIAQPIPEWYSTAQRLSSACSVSTAGFYWESLNSERVLELSSKGAQKKLHKAWSLAKKQVAEAAGVLKSTLEGLVGKYDVHIVAHSLGCRVVLKCIRELREADKLKSVTLLAAACTEKHFPKLALKKMSECRKLNVYSRSDFVLSRMYAAAESGLNISTSAGVGKMLFDALGYLSQDKAVGAGVDVSKFGFSNINVEELLSLQVGHMQYANVADKVLEKLLFENKR